MIPLARLKDSKNASFFPNHNPLSAWEYNSFNAKGDGMYETPSRPVRLNWKNDWRKDDKIEVICYGI